ncbi:cyclin-dependent kinase-like 2 [Xenopus laevis]|uniref:Cyclin-dependent kinase-like 2 n=1 Tax=Xenopus laevis TaxID=8355 RepID=A0A8J0UTY7_XENLA|nr:cyclin-dependent kinase-like 2 [Xenopus laevis]XP_018107855.1 cyclin-dependent kinase-like 2 [Xenopus laevis]
MEKYENLGLVGEGSYGMVMKCRNKETGRIVAIKKFLESEDDKMVKKIAMREIKLLKQLRHENLVNLLEVCKKKKRWYLVFEFVDRTVLDDLEQFPNGLDFNRVRKYLFQIIRGIGFCHNHNIIHRDIKPENILVSLSGIVKLCDFGFARTLAGPGEDYTDYVATRWYRAPELLVGDIKYGKAVDVWAIGCIVTEMLTAQPLFPGDSDIDQLHHIIKCQGNLTPRHQELFYRNPMFAGVSLPDMKEAESLERRYPKHSPVMLDLAKSCLHIDPEKRPACGTLLQHELFTKDNFSERFSQEIRAKLQNLSKDNSSQSKKVKNHTKEKEDYAIENKTVAFQDCNFDSKTKELKASKVKIMKTDLEKGEKSDAFSNSFYSGGTNQNKMASHVALKETSNSLDLHKSAGIIPPISYNLTAISPYMNSNANTVSGIGHVHFRGEEKNKLFISPLKKSGKPAMGSYYNQNFAPLVDKSPLQKNKKRWDFSKSEIRLPELHYSHLPELKGTDCGTLFGAQSSKLTKKDIRTVQEPRIPSLAISELHNPSMALPQVLGSLLQETPDANFPPVEH